MRTPDERREVMRERVASWARRLNVQPRQVRVQQMNCKWGVAQIAQMQGMVVSAIADIDLARARYAYTAGYGDVAVGTQDALCE